MCAYRALIFKDVNWSSSVRQRRPCFPTTPSTVITCRESHCTVNKDDKTFVHHRNVLYCIIQTEIGIFSYSGALLLVKCLTACWVPK